MDAAVIPARPAPEVLPLKGGVRAVVDPLPGLESLAVSVVIDAGARFETEETAGWAHLLEHMVFKGAGGRSSREIVEAVEGEGGHVNAATGLDRTSFQIRCLRQGLPLAMEILADLVRRPHMDPEDLEREKGVIAQEIAEAYDQPDDHVFELAQAKAFGDHPLGRPILGEVVSLKDADPARLRAFHARHYAPRRMIVSAAGAVDPDLFFALAQTGFASEASSEGTDEGPPAARFLGGEGREARRLEQAHLVFLAEGVSRLDPDYFAASVFTEILGGGMSSRLFQEVREAEGLAYAIDAYQDAFFDTGLLGVYAGTAGRDATPAAKLAAEVLKRMADGVSEGELSRAKAQIKGGLFMGREAPLNRAEANANNLHSFGRLIPLGEMSERIDAVSFEDLRRLGERFVKGPVATAVLGPKSALAAGAAFSETLRRG